MPAGGEAAGVPSVPVIEILIAADVVVALVLSVAMAVSEWLPALGEDHVT
jgi:hypothetical protein